MTDSTIISPSYALLQSTMDCWKCGQTTVVTAIWVPRLTEFDEEGTLDVDDPAVLQYTGSVDTTVEEFLASAAPLMRVGESRTAGGKYWANHCSHCGALQGDHHVMGVDGPFFPQSRSEFDSVSISPGAGGLSAGGSYWVGGWMSWVTDRLEDH